MCLSQACIALSLISYRSYRSYRPRPCTPGILSPCSTRGGSYSSLVVHHNVCLSITGRNWSTCRNALLRNAPTDTYSLARVCEDAHFWIESKFLFLACLPVQMCRLCLLNLKVADNSSVNFLLKILSIFMKCIVFSH